MVSIVHLPRLCLNMPIEASLRIAATNASIFLASCHKCLIYGVVFFELMI